MDNMLAIKTLPITMDNFVFLC